LDDELWALRGRGNLIESFCSSDIEKEMSVLAAVCEALRRFGALSDGL